MKATFYLTDVASLTLRAVPGDGEQVEVLAKTSSGGVVPFRFIARRGRALRVTDLRPRDKKRATKAGVPFAALAREED